MLKWHLLNFFNSSDSVVILQWGCPAGFVFLRDQWVAHIFCHFPGSWSDFQTVRLCHRFHLLNESAVWNLHQRKNTTVVIQACGQHANARSSFWVQICWRRRRTGLCYEPPVSAITPCFQLFISDVWHKRCDINEDTDRYAYASPRRAEDCGSSVKRFRRGVNIQSFSSYMIKLNVGASQQWCC